MIFLLELYQQVFEIVSFLVFSSAEYAEANKQILTTSLTHHCKYITEIIL